ncbi:hypothetical protein HY772_06140 [Candidatus Woesearchaeota archaeon]|nr:hypothetical protein [Candidatus Woesearchaeota archaeon]
MGKISFSARLVAPYFAEIPPEIKERWLSGSKKAVSKTYKGLKKPSRPGRILRKR